MVFLWYILLIVRRKKVYDGKKNQPQKLVDYCGINFSCFYCWRVLFFKMENEHWST